MKKKKILIVLADVGNGHRSAANALTKAFEKIDHQEYELKTIDLFALADVQPFNSSDDTYSLVSKNQVFEEVNNFFFRFFNTHFGFSLFTSYTLSFMQKECTKIIEEEDPDIVVSVHPIVSIIISSIHRIDESKFKYINVITDLVTLFKGWADKYADLTFSPTEEAYNLLLELGLDKKKIISPLFPINPDMERVRQEDIILKELNFETSNPIITLTGGGVGTESLRKAISKIVDRKDFNLIVICGKSESLKEELTQRYIHNKSVKVLGYVNNIQDYFSVSDIIITKPGPATILEIQLFKKKAILTKPIGEQEKGNIGFALQDPNFKYIGKNWDLLNESIDHLKEIHITSGNTSRSFNEAETIMKKILGLD